MNCNSPLTPKLAAQEAPTRPTLGAIKKKIFFQGAQRTCPPEQTLERLRPHFGRLGITRLADVTGLDMIGIPVAQAIRPMSRSLSVKQGKGVTLTAAFASAAMEAAEEWHAENIRLDLPRGSARQMQRSGRVADLSGLSKDPARIPAGWMDAEITWAATQNLVDGLEFMAPYDCLHLDFTRPAETDFLIRSSNGLASGNTLAGAVLHALLEVIERDALAYFWALDRSDRRVRRIDPKAAIRLDDTLAWMLAQIEAAGLRLELFDATSDLAVPVVIAKIYRTAAASGRRPGSQTLGASAGHGAHLDPTVALIRAVTEAAQSRLTRIAGSRDDLTPQDYTPAAGHNMSELIDQVFDLVAYGYAPFAYADVSGTDAARDIDFLVAQLHSAGLDQVLMVDLSHDEFPMNVARVVVPGLGRFVAHSKLQPGRRFAS